MKPDDVTHEMLLEFCKHSPWIQDNANLKQVIAAAWNAVVSDDEPITAEWLLANGYENNGISYQLIFKNTMVLFVTVTGEPVRVAIADLGISRVINLPDTKTIGQLRALHAGLGIGEVS